MYQFRHRYYHAQLGRFISRDPIGYDGGDANLYRYVGNRPTNAVDPSGLTFITDAPTPTEFQTVLPPGELANKMDANYAAVRKQYLAGQEEPKCEGRDRFGTPKWIEWRTTTLGQSYPGILDPTFGRPTVATFTEVLEFDLMSRQWEGLLKATRAYKVNTGAVGKLPKSTVEWQKDTTWYVSGTLAAKQKIQVYWQEYRCCECEYGHFDPWNTWNPLATVPTGKKCGRWIKYYLDVKDLGPSYGWTDLAYRQGETMVTITGITIAGWGGKM